MPASDVSFETIEYCLILVSAHAQEVLVIDRLQSNRLPTLKLPQTTHPARELQKALHNFWKVDAIILDLLRSPDGLSAYAVAEILSPYPVSPLKAIPWETVRNSELPSELRPRVESIFAGNAPSGKPFARIGWIDDAIAWLESATGERISSKTDIQQYKVGHASTLVRFRVEDGSGYWLKATGEPNLHERSLTEFLDKHCAGYLPTLISSKPEWNAWIAAEEGTALPDGPTTPFQLFTELEQAVLSMAKIQDNVQGCSLDLLDAGAMDQGMEVFGKQASELFDYLEEAMSREQLDGARRLPRKRLSQLRETFEEVCYRMQELGLGETIVHGNLTWSNILTGWGVSQFIDWSEAYLAHPFIALQRLLDLNQVDSPEIRDLIHRVLVDKYRNHWKMNYASDWVDEGLIYMPLVAIGSSLYGRGDWLRTPARYEADRFAHARTLARRLDRAAREQHSRLLSLRDRAPEINEIDARQRSIAEAPHRRLRTMLQVGASHCRQ